LAVFISILTYQVYRKGIFRSYSQIFVLILIFAIYTTYKIDLITGNKEKNNLKVLAIKLSTEHDPVAEMLIENIDQKIKNDDLIKEYLFTDPLQFEELYSYLRKNYFTGYWNKYDFQLTACNPKDSLYVGVPENNWYHCHNFFNNLLLQYGVDIPESNFYYLDNFNGRISYFGEFPIYKGDQTYTLFLELDSRLVQVEMGYPELLIDEETSDNTINNKFAYAKYHEKKLISQSGEFHYSLNISTYDIKDKKTTFRNFEGYNHLIYKLDKENTIIISTPSKTFFNHLLSFTYIFGFYFVLISLLYSLINIKKLKNQFHLSLRNRIQFAGTAILIISLLLVATGTILLSKRQFKEKHNEILREKIQSVYIELDHKLAFEDTLTSEWQTEKYDNLNQLLIKFSDVFYSDINLYNTDGQLIATSRPEIFDQFLLTDRIDFEAYEQLHLNKKAEFIHEERIGGLNYLSAYVPFLNAENELLAYLNLPYFTRQDNLRSEITNLVVAVINVYAILILITLSLAYLISNQITKPVSLLQNRLAQIQLGKRNQYLSYKNKDEIGQLVEVYNQMVDELEQSAQLLAKTERESAWREMAKQIAHEIKNPLTPMKLNVQHFKRSFDPERPDWKEKLEKFSDNLVNHINNLSAIATEFSNFAKMPQAKNEKIDLVKVIQDAYSLFKSQKHIKLEIKSELEKAYIIADKEQMLRVFINLIKNAFQAIPEEKEGIITIDIRKTKGWVKIAVKDNGTGIPNDIRDKLFQPSFTTKSSGMGLGLAIVKNIVQYSGGTIDYDTHESEGTEFFIHLPLAN
jgi:signal transduction histidine kinase